MRAKCPGRELAATPKSHPNSLARDSPLTSLAPFASTNKAQVGLNDSPMSAAESYSGISRKFTLKGNHGVLPLSQPVKATVDYVQAVIPTGRPVYGLVVYHLPNRVISCRYVSSWGVVEALRYNIPSSKSLSAQGRAKIILLVETEVHCVH
jgi:hypothetical protein